MALSRLKNLSPQRIDALLAGIIFFLAFVLRLIGIGWGLPNDLHNQSYHPDELPNYAVSRQIEPTRLDFAPGFYNYGTLYFTVLRIATDITLSYGGGSDNPWKEAGSAHMAGRAINVVAGAMTALLVFLIIRRFTNAFGATLGALLIAFAPGHVVHSRFQTVDVFQTFLLAVSLYFACRVLEDEPIDAPWSRSPTLLAGLFAGLAMSTKYTGILALLSLFVALGFRKGKDWWRSALPATGVAAGAFVLTTPGVLTDTQTFLRDFTFELGHSATGHGLVFLGYPSGFLYHLTNLVVGVGFLCSVLGTVGLIGGGFKRAPLIWVVLVSALPYYILIGRAEVMFLRYTFPLYLALACGLGWLMGLAHERKGAMSLLAVLGIFAVAGIDFGGLRGAVQMTTYMTAEDPRDEAARYLKAQGNVLVGFASDPWFYTPPVYADTGLPRSVPPAKRDEVMAAAHDPRAIFIPYGPEDRSSWNPALIEESRPDFIVLSSFETEDVARLSKLRSLPPIAELTVERARKFTDLLQAQYRLVRLTPSLLYSTFGKPGTLVHDLEYIRPNIQIWKRKTLP